MNIYFICHILYIYLCTTLYHCRIKIYEIHFIRIIYFYLRLCELIPLLQQLLISGTAGLLDQEQASGAPRHHSRSPTHDVTWYGSWHWTGLVVNVCWKNSLISKRVAIVFLSLKMSEESMFSIWTSVHSQDTDLSGSKSLVHQWMEWLRLQGKDKLIG